MSRCGYNGDSTPKIKSIEQKWMEAEVKRLGSCMSYWMGAQVPELAEAYHQKYVGMQFLLAEEERK